MITLGVVTDLHFGPKALFDGKLRKLSHRAPELTKAFAARMRDVVRPDVVINLGDAIEDENPQLDARRYAHFVSLLNECEREVIHVAGNHDLVHLDAAALQSHWGRPPDGPLYHSLDRRGVHLVVLYTHERKDLDVTIDADQLAWLRTDLAANPRPTVILMHHSAADQDLRGNRWFEKAAHLCLLQERKALRAALREHGHVRAVLNGHLHWNHLDVIDSIPYITLQSLIENVDDDAPGTPAAAHAVVRISDTSVSVEVAGAHPARYQLETLRS